MLLVILLYNTVQHRFITAFLHRIAVGTKKQKIAVAVYLFDFWFLLSFHHSMKGFLCFLAHRHVAETAFCLWLGYVETVLVLEIAPELEVHKQIQGEIR